MKALLCTRYGTPDDLASPTSPNPTPGPGEAVVRVKAAALNFFDTLIIAGKYQIKPALPVLAGRRVRRRGRKRRRRRHRARTPATA